MRIRAAGILASKLENRRPALNSEEATRTANSLSRELRLLGLAGAPVAPPRRRGGKLARYDTIVAEANGGK